MRMEDENDWSLEVVNTNGTSTCWQDLFTSDIEANAEFERTVKEDGIQAFLDVAENVVVSKEVRRQISGKRNLLQCIHDLRPHFPTPFMTIFRTLDKRIISANSNYESPNRHSLPIQNLWRPIHFFRERFG